MTGDTRPDPPAEPAQGCLVFAWQGQTWWALPERALWWPARRTLLVADLHIGKADSFRRAGVALPGGDEGTLAGLSALVRRFDAERVIVLGDLVHRSADVGHALAERVRVWCASCPARVMLVEGNHDRGVGGLLDSWGVARLGSSHEEEGLLFIHDPGAVGKGWKGGVIAGHLHPGFMLRTRGDALRLPCFRVGRRVLVLPAFTAFSGHGPDVPVQKGERVLICAEERVLEFS